MFKKLSLIALTFAFLALANHASAQQPVTVKYQLQSVQGMSGPFNPIKATFYTNGTVYFDEGGARHVGHWYEYNGAMTMFFDQDGLKFQGKVDGYRVIDGGMTDRSGQSYSLRLQ